MKFVVYPQEFHGILAVNAVVGKASSTSFEESLQSLHDSGVWVTACFDTGATKTMIKEEIANRLGLTEIVGEQFSMNAGDQSPTRIKKYTADIFIPGEQGTYLHLQSHTVGAMAGGMIDMLIGMDVISQGDFSLTRTHQGFQLQLSQSASQ